MVLRLLLFLVFWGQVALCFAAPVPRVINGENAPKNAFPWMAALIAPESIPDLDLTFCGATVVDSRYVLTAAHCVHDLFGELLRARDVEVLVGRKTLSEETGERLSVQRIIPLPEYDPERFVPIGDLALLRLSGETSTPVISLATRSIETAHPPGSSSSVLGWGIMNPDALSVFPDTLQIGELPLLEDSLCEERYGLLFHASSMVCAGKLSSSQEAKDGVDTCNGDSGGPLFVEDDGRYFQIGITSFGFRCEDVEFPGIYTRVAE
ncbi:MAG: serine protease [Bdellovibrionales bacterium]|nr:serine protease [Bdellovibrionales bacterium]